VRAFVIGATGYIGNVFAHRLMQAGHPVMGTARTPKGGQQLSAEGIHPVLASLEEPRSLFPGIRDADIIVYAAYGYEDKQQAEKELASGKSHLTEMLTAIERTGKIFLLTSGSGIFPNTGDMIYTEDMPLPETTSPVVLARRKLEQEVLAASARSICSIVLRPPTVYGRGGSSIIPGNLLEHALSAKRSVYIEHTRTNRWSAVHIDDLADLMMLAVDKANPGSLYNAAAESGITTAAISRAISRVAGLQGQTTAITLKEARDVFGDWAEWLMINNQLSGDKARTELGWNPYRDGMLEDIEHGSYARVAASSS
jgi:nucleoside-diphosphate-sugar epimerase